jgi:hypothetical protein
MLLIGPRIDDCPGCGVAYGQPHADRCKIRHCSVFNAQTLSCGCEEHDALNATWRGMWAFPTGVDVEDGLEETADQETGQSFVVNLYAALNTWNPDNLWDRPFVVRFDGFAEAKEYVVKNLEDVIHIFTEALKEIRKANSVEEFEKLPIWCTDLVTEER